MDALRTTRVNLLLASLGAVCGVPAAMPITALGKLITGAQPATPSNCLWNMGVFAVLAAIGSPFLTWSALRRVAVWRAIGEPAIVRSLAEPSPWRSAPRSDCSCSYRSASGSLLGVFTTCIVR